jgi:hypothetical protein
MLAVGLTMCRADEGRDAQVAKTAQKKKYSSVLVCVCGFIYGGKNLIGFPRPSFKVVENAFWSYVFGDPQSESNRFVCHVFQNNKLENLSSSQSGGEVENPLRYGGVGAPFLGATVHLGRYPPRLELGVLNHPPRFSGLLQ